MIKKIILFALLIATIITQASYSDERHEQANAFIPCAPELQSCLNKIQQLPEARDLIAVIQKEGAIRIVVNNDPYLTKKFGAFWDPVNRVITVNYSKSIPEGSLIGSIVFEMHNALVNAKMLHLDNLAMAGKIEKDAYIESFERLEYQNSKDASRLVSKGIQKNIFPKSAYLPTYPNFETHFCVQKESGHSDFFARNFDMLTSRKRFFRN